MPTRLLALCLLLGVSLVGYAQNSGSIHITALGADGSPLPHESVNVSRPMDAGPPRTCWTDDQGTCSIDHLPLDEYEVFFDDYKQGYPRPSPFYSGRSFNPTIITLSESNPAQNIVLHLGPKSGFLKLIVTDAISGKPILPISFRISWASDPENTILTGRGDDLTVLVPAGIPLTLAASSDGYREWSYQSDAAPANHTLVLQSGEHQTLNIRLQPQH